MSASSYSAAVLADSPAAYWKLNEQSGLPVDYSGNSKDITNSSGTPLYRSPGPFTTNESTELDPNGWFYRPTVSTTTSAWTVEAMVAFHTWQAAGPYGYPYSCGDPSTGGSGDGFQVGINNATQKMMAVDNNQGIWADGATTLSLCTWYLLTWTRTGTGGSGGHYYINGTLDADVTTFGPAGGPTGNSLINRTQPFHGLGQSNDAFYAHLSVYNNALSGTRIAAHAAAAGTLAGSPCLHVRRGVWLNPPGAPLAHRASR